MLPAYRNPTNDPPRLGEMIHVVRPEREAPGIVNAIYRGSLMAFVMPASLGHAETQHFTFDDYDPTEDPALFTWHFDHR